MVLLDRMVKRAPELPEPLYFRAEARRLRGRDSDLDEAIADLRQAIALGNPPAQVHRSLGYIHQKRAQPAEASAEFARYIELAPDAPDVGLIRTYVLEGKS
jgi:Flp pilus assembly protein TadD